MKINQSNIVLGCGLSGMLTALSLAQIGVKTTIIESKSTRSAAYFKDNRTTALTPYSTFFLKEINVWQELEKYASPMVDVYVVDNKKPEILHLINETEKNLPLGYVIKNSDFKNILLSKVVEHPLIKLIDKCEYQFVKSYIDHSVIEFDNMEAINCDLIIICDGANSRVRAHYFTNEIEKTYQTALTFNIKHEIAHDNCAMEHFLPLGPFALLPLKNKNSSSVIWSTSKMQAELLINLPEDELEFLVQRNCGKSLGKITIDSEVEAFPLKARLANRYFHNRLVLIADSAHIVHPLAGQGLNQGIKDIESLSMLINNLGLGKEALQQYQTLRQDDNFMMYKLTDELNNIFSCYSKNLHYLRQIGFKAINNLKPIKNLMTNYAMGER